MLRFCLACLLILVLGSLMPAALFGPSSISADSLDFGNRQTRLSGREVGDDWETLALVPSVASESTTVFFDYGPFAVWFDPATRVPALTVHRLREHAFLNESRAMHWRSETRLPPWLQVHTDDYLTSRHEPQGPFDRGHMVPHADMGDVASEVATYIMTNAAPQLESLNRGAWKIMEYEIRELVSAQSEADDDAALVFTGSIFDAELPQAWIPLDAEGPARVRIPNGFFKLVCFLGADGEIDSVRVWIWRQEYIDDYVEASAWHDLGHQDLEDVEELTGIQLLPE